MQCKWHKDKERVFNTLPSTSANCGCIWGLKRTVQNFFLIRHGCPDRLSALSLVWGCTKHLKGEVLHYFLEVPLAGI